ncbi:4-hydroxy-tetrahydrodipicolinate reductase [Proteiniclasticum sp. C24MP]|uniref:4-hydroxy-tetrahydrodipicolinate reductase n=1 Tax=Proteiniclasticum sp. C24MP TaxID=3374101 RepID=UPI003754F63C
MKVILFGAGGQMGRAISALYEEDHPEVEVVLVDREESAYVSSMGGADVAIDFSGKEALGTILSYCRENQVPLVIGTTGHEEKDLAEIEEAARLIPIIKSGNYSLGVYVLKHLAREAARLLGEDADVEIIEKHHNRKKDAPSGTALLLADAVDAGGVPHERVYGREGVSPRKKGELGIHAVRGGSIVGEHTVLFALESESLELVHRGESRMLFARGAVKAAQFIINQKPGLYAMDHMMKG